MPVFFALAELGARRRGWVFLLLAVGVAGLQLLAGHPQAAGYALLAGVGYGIFRGWQQGTGRGFLFAVGLGVPLAGGVLAAVQLLPTAELLQVSVRGGGLSWEQFAGMSLPPERLITLLLPDFFGNSGTGSYWGREAGFFIQLCAYTGVLPLLFGLAALRERRDGLTGFFGALCGLALVLSLGRFTRVYAVLYGIPGLDFFRIPTRFLLWFAFGAAVLSGLGLDRILARGESGPRRGWWALGVLLLLAAGGMVWLNREVLTASSAVLGARGGEALVQYGRELRGDLLRLVLLVGAGGWILAGGGRRRERWLAALAAPLLVYADLYSFGRDFNGLIDPEVYLRPPPAASAIAADAVSPRGMAPRILSLVSEKNAPYDWHGGWVLDQSSYRKYPGTLRLYTGGLYGLANSLPGWSPLHPRRHWEFVRGYPGFADLAGVEYVVSYRPVSHPGLEPIFDGEVKVYRNRTALPRAYLVGNYRVIADGPRRLQYMRSPRFDPRREVVLEEEPEAGAAAGRGEVRVEAYAAEKVSLRLGERTGGLLVLSDTFYPGWRAYVDGKEQPILRANHVFRAVEVPSGAQKVVFHFRPGSFRIGGWLSGASWAALLLLLVVFRRQTGVPASLPETTGSAAKIWTVQGVLIVLIHALVTQWPLWAGALERSCVLSAWGGG